MRTMLWTMLLFAGLMPVAAQHTTSPASEGYEYASNLLEKAVSAQECIGIAAGISVNGALKWQEGAGFSDLENSLAFEAATLTRIASITKPMTAIAIMQLFEEGKLDLDVPIQTYLPAFPVKQEGKMTIRQLLQHASGLGGYQSDKEQENEKNYPTLADAVAIFQDRDLISEPGKAFNYSTYGYVVLGLIIEKVSGQSYEAYLQTNIWDKAGMTQTGIEYADKRITNQATTYHRNSKGKIKAVKPTNLSDRIPGGGVYSCATDLLKFGDAVLNNRLISARTLNLMLEDPQLKKEGNAYGFGWYLYGENPKYGNVFGHNGTQTGASAFLMLLPDQKTAIAVLSNTSGAMQRVSDIAVKLFDVVGN